MPELANSASHDLVEASRAAAVAPAGDDPAPRDLADYVTPPPKIVIAVAVRYGEVRKGVPLPYDLEETTEGS